MTQLSKNFTLEEFLETSSKAPNIPNQTQIRNMTLLATKVLQPVREIFGSSMTINSGFRSLAVNHDQGGTSTPLSQHCKGQAADIYTIDNAKLFHLIKDNFIFDQMIWEAGDSKQPAWVHVSYNELNNRRQCLRMTIVKGRKVYTPFK